METKNKMMTKKQKQGFLVVFEATLALLILFGFLFTSIERQKQITDQSYNRDDQTFMLLKYIQEYIQKEDVRQDINNINLLNEKTNDYLTHFTQNLNSRIVVCEISEICGNSENIPKDKEVSTSEFLIYTTEETKKVKVYLWEK